MKKNLKELLKLEKELADNLEQAYTLEKEEIPSAPPDEFQKIMEEMKRRGIEPKVRTELKKEKKSPAQSRENDS